MTQSQIPAPYTMTAEAPEVFSIEWGGLPMLVLNIFFFNLLVSAFCLITLTGLIFFLFSAAVLVWRAWFWGSLLSQLPTSPFLTVLPTLILEGEAYVLASMIGVVLGLSWLKPGSVFSDEHLSRLEAFKEAWREAAHLYVAVAILLFVAAVVEAVTIMSVA